MDFTTVISHPLGLTAFAFALSLVFDVTGTFAHKSNKTPRWLPEVAVVLAAVCLISGLLLAYHQLQEATLTASNERPQQWTSENVAATRGDCAPAFAGVSVGGSIVTNCKRLSDHQQASPSK
jgi:hypothetical protein